MALIIFEFPREGKNCYHPKSSILSSFSDLVVKIELWKSKEGAPADNQKGEQVEPRAWMVGQDRHLQRFSVEHKFLRYK